MEQYTEFKEFLNPVNVKSILEIKSILENTFDNYETKKKEYFLEWLEFSFLNDLKLSIKKNNIPNGRFFSELNDKHNEIIKQKIDFIDKWILLKKEELKPNILTEPEAIDLSNTTATEKIIYLHKLGVIDFLRKQEPFNYSINSLATVLSAVTGEKSGTIQPMLNPMLSEFNDQKNNPLKSKKAVPKVEQQLIKSGFKLK
jgi:hypothetical protein